MSASTTTQEQVWQGKPEGFEAQLVAADKLLETDAFAAYVLFATAYYSHFSSLIFRRPLEAWNYFKQAKQSANGAYSIIDWETVTAGQCDVLATIMMRRWLWSPVNLAAAERLLLKGIMLKPIAHSEALIRIGLAETCYWRNGWVSIDSVQTALDLEEVVGREPDQVQAQRQFGRVLSRAGALYHYHRDRLYEESKCWEKAWAIANHPEWGSKSQRRKIKLERLMVRLPKFLRLLLPQ